MVVDLLRTAYQTEMRFFRDDPRTTTVRWYRCKPGALPLPFSTPFRSLNNVEPDLADVQQELGEQLGAPRVWVDGSYGGTATGQGYCGTADQWHDGQPLPPDVPVERDSAGTPLCCPRIEPQNTCPNLHSDFDFDTYNCQLAGPWTGFPCGALALSFQLERDPVAVCSWAGFTHYVDSGGNRFYIVIDIVEDSTLQANYWFLDSNNNAELLARAAGTIPWDGGTPITLTLVQEPNVVFVPCSPIPSTVTISPP